MSKASYRAKSSGLLGTIDPVPLPRRKITLKAYRRDIRRRNREARKLWRQV